MTMVGKDHKRFKAHKVVKMEGEACMYDKFGFCKFKDNTIVKLVSFSLPAKQLKVVLKDILSFTNGLQMVQTLALEKTVTIAIPILTSIQKRKSVKEN